MEGGVEDGHVRNIRQYLPGDPDAGQVRRVVQRCQGGELIDGPFHVVVDDDRFGEAVATVHHTVTDRGQADVGQRRAVLVEHVEHGLQAGLVIGQVELELDGLAVAVVPHMAAALADPFHQAPGRYMCVVGVDELVFDRRRSAVEHEYRCTHHTPRRAVSSGLVGRFGRGVGLVPSDPAISDPLILHLSTVLRCLSASPSTLPTCRRNKPKSACASTGPSPHHTSPSSPGGWTTVGRISSGSLRTASIPQGSVWLLPHSQSANDSR